MLQWCLDNPEAALALAVMLLNLLSMAVRRASPKAADLMDAAIPLSVNAAHRALAEKRAAQAPAPKPDAGAE